MATSGDIYLNNDMNRRPNHATILIVDDDETELFLLRHNLEGAGFAVREAATAEEGLDACRSNRPDALVLDATLPGMDGFEMCRLLRTQSAYRGLPILMLTGREDPQCRTHAFEAGVTDFMTKTTDWEHIVTRVRTLVDTGSLAA